MQHSIAQFLTLALAIPFVLLGFTVIFGMVHWINSRDDPQRTRRPSRSSPLTQKADLDGNDRR